jgi:hypothetical protein
MADYGANVLQIIINFALHIGYQAVIPQSFASSVETIANMPPDMQALSPRYANTG